MTDFGKLLATLTAAGVRFVLVGGAAAVAHGAARLTLDIDIVYDRSPGNLRRLAAALAPFAPYPRGFPPGLPFVWDDRTLANGLNFTLTTATGDIDLLGEITGGGGYADLIRDAIVLHAFGHDIQCLSLPKLIEVKRAAGRPKDLEVIAELQLLLDQDEME